MECEELQTTYVPLALNILQIHALLFSVPAVLIYVKQRLMAG